MPACCHVVDTNASHLRVDGDNVGERKRDSHGTGGDELDEGVALRSDVWVVANVQPDVVEGFAGTHQHVEGVGKDEAHGTCGVGQHVVGKRGREGKGKGKREREEMECGGVRRSERDNNLRQRADCHICTKRK